MRILNISNIIRALAVVVAFACYGCIDVSSSTPPSTNAVDSTANVTVTTATPGGTATASVSSGNNSTRAGWTIGGGSEWAFWDRWSAKLEYLYIDLGTFSSTFAFAGLPGASLASLTTSSHVTDNIFRAGINYHFGAPWTPPH